MHSAATNPLDLLFEEAELHNAPAFVRAFEHTPGTKIEFGCGSIGSLPRFVRELSASRALIVTDAGIAGAGHLQKAIDLLEEDGLQAAVFDRVIENPTSDCVRACVAVAQESHADVLIGLGGGSSMDTAKGCNFIHTNGGRMRDYWGHDKATKPMLPMIAIPTTAGTGSECQSFALISDPETHAKMACGDHKAAARIAILDPELTVTQPQLVTAHTGIDALTHAIESGVCNKRSEISIAYAKAAYQLLITAFPAVIDDRGDIIARSQMLVGAALAGTAIENSMLGAAHSAANPLTAQFDVVHGEAVGIMLPHVMRFNATDETTAIAYRELCGESDIEDLCKNFTALLEKGHMPTSLSSYGIKDSDIAKLADQAATQMTAQFNPIPVDPDAFARLYGVAL
jgi:alcohol dehydrogenase